MTAVLRSIVARARGAARRGAAILVPGSLSAIVALAMLVPLVALVAGCGIAASTGGAPVASSVPQPSYPAEIGDTRRLIASALGTVSIELQDATQPYRPPESPSFVGAPRGIFQAVLPDDPGHGYIAVYSFRDVAAATAAANDQAAFIASGPVRVQFPPDAQFLIRQVDTTVVFYSWSPANSTDDRAPAVFTALGTVGLAIPIPR